MADMEILSSSASSDECLSHEPCVLVAQLSHASLLLCSRTTPMVTPIEPHRHGERIVLDATVLARHDAQSIRW